MVTAIDLRVSLETAEDDSLLRQALIRKTGWLDQDIRVVRVIRRSLDARSRPPVVQIRLEVFLHEEPGPDPVIRSEFQMVDQVTEEGNERGDASHARYKERQRVAVMERLKLGNATRRRKKR